MDRSRRHDPSHAVALAHELTGRVPLALAIYRGCGVIRIPMGLLVHLQIYRADEDRQVDEEDGLS